MSDPVPPKKLAIYYGWPIAVNGTWSVSAATDVFDDYDMVVFGAGLEDSGHPQYGSTNDIINDTTADVYGYIDATLSQSVFEGKVDDWEVMGGTGSQIKGIFCDQFGYDFGMTREKQNDEIEYIHGKGLKAFVNAWDPDDVFESGPTGPTGTAMTSDDWYLGESFQIVNGDYQNVNDWKTKADKMKDYKDNGPGNSNMATVTTYDNSAFDQDKWDYSYYSCALYGFDAAGWGEENFSASSASLPYRTRKDITGTKLTGTISENSGVFEINTNIGIKVNTNDKTVSSTL